MKNESLIRELFKGKRVTKMGFGPNGRSFGDIIFLVQAGAHVLVTDYRDEPDIQRSKELLLAKLTEDDQLRLSFVLGEHRESDFVDTDMVIQASGVPLNSPYIHAARDTGVPIYTSSALVYKIARENFEVVTIGVTGTKGKSTTTDMIEHTLRENNISYHVAGNVRGIANLPILGELENGDVILGELDSWQLQGFGDISISPNIAVFTSFFEDHLNYYDGSMQRYFDDKAKIYKHQDPGDITLISHQVAHVIEQYDENLSQNIIVVDQGIIQNVELSVLGAHNRANAALAFAACEQIGLNEDDIASSLESYRAMEGRSQYLGEKKGIYYYNDNNSTTPLSSIKTLNSLRDHYADAKIYLIGGGADKEFDYTEFSKALPAIVERGVLFKGAATEKILAGLPKADHERFDVVDSMKAAWDTIHKYSKEGDVVVLSPGAASFGVFLNEYERGDQFVSAFNE